MCVYHSIFFLTCGFYWCVVCTVDSTQSGCEIHNKDILFYSLQPKGTTSPLQNAQVGEMGSEDVGKGDHPPSPESRVGGRGGFFNNPPPPPANRWSEEGRLPLRPLNPRGSPQVGPGEGTPRSGPLPTSPPPSSPSPPLPGALPPPTALPGPQAGSEAAALTCPASP